MSADRDKSIDICPESENHASVPDSVIDKSNKDDVFAENNEKTARSVRFPSEDKLVTQYFEPANPWQDVTFTTRAQLAAEYLEACRRHSTTCIDSVLQQIRELPESAIGGGVRAARLTLAECALLGAAPCDALEALLRKVQFRRLEIEHAAVDDEGAEALFDMVEYYESATVVSISGPRQFGIRGWQAASRMIKKSAELQELEVTDSALESSHAPVLARALKPHTCRLRALCLQRVSLCGDPLLCLVIALKSNSSIRELRLGDNRLSASDAAQLASLLRFNTRLQLLDLSNNQIQDAGVAHIADALVEQAAQTPPSAAASPMSPHHCLVSDYESRGLAFLVLWNNQLTRNCAPHLSKALRASRSLCVLNVGRNCLGWAAVGALLGGAALALASLGLQAAALGHDAAAALAQLARPPSHLQRLDLRDNKLGSAGLQAILTALTENTTLTQIDLDEPPEASSLCAEAGEAAAVRRLTLEIRALCRRNEGARPPQHALHRKISLTCHTHCLAGALGGEEQRRGARLRSPAPSPAPSPSPSPAPSPSPSPAGSPVPKQHAGSRFSVTRVTPERECSVEPAAGHGFSATPSRFKVVQVMEPPQIQIHPATNAPRKTSSRFSVTRNYDTIYNPALTPSPPPPSPALDNPRTEEPSTTYHVIGSRNVTDSSDDKVINKECSTDDRTTKDCNIDTIITVKSKIAPSATTQSKEVSRITIDSKTDLNKCVNVSKSPNITTVESKITKEDIIDVAVDSRCPVDIIIESNTTANSNIESKTITTNSKNDFSSAMDSKISAISSISETVSTIVAITEPPNTRLLNEANPPITAEVVDNCPLRDCQQPPTAKSVVSGCRIKADARFHCSQFTESTDKCRGYKTIQTGLQPSEVVAPITKSAVSNSRKEVTIPKNDNRATQFTNLPQEAVTNVVYGLDNQKFGTQPMTTSTVGNNNLIVRNENVDRCTQIPSPQPCATGYGTIINQSGVDCGSQTQFVYSVEGGGTQSLVKNQTRSVASQTYDSIEPGTYSKTSLVPAEPTVTEPKRTPMAVTASDSDKSDRNTQNETGKSRDYTSVSVQTDKLIISDHDVIVDSIKLASDVMDVDSFSDVLSCVDVNEYRVGTLSAKSDFVGVNIDSGDSDDAIREVQGSKPVNVVKLEGDSSKRVDNESVDGDEAQFNSNTRIDMDTGCARIEKDDARIEKQSISDGARIDKDPHAKHKDTAVQQLVAITEDLSNIIKENMRDLTKKKDCMPAIRETMLKKNRSESSLDSPDLEVSRLMNKRLVNSPFDSNSSLEISESSTENIYEKPARENVERRVNQVLSNESSLESASDVTPINSNLLNLSQSSAESVSPVFSKNFRIHDSLSSLEASVSSLESTKQERIMVTSADSGIEYSLQIPAEKEDSSSNEGTLTNNSSLKESVKKTDCMQLLDSLTSSPKRTSSLLDMPALKSKGLDRMRKISWVAPSSSFQVPKHDDREVKPSHLEKLLSLFQHPSSIFSRNTSDEEKKSNTPPRKDSSLTSSFWSWGTAVEKDIDEDSEATDSTLSERVQVSFVDESFSKRLDSKTPSTDTDTLSEYQQFPNEVTTECVIVQSLDVSKDSFKCIDSKEESVARPRTFAAVLKSGSENSLEKQASPETGQSVEKLPSKVIRGIKENISPENTLTSSMTNTLAVELAERQVRSDATKNEPKSDGGRVDLAPIATIDEACDISADIATKNIDLGKDALAYLAFENADSLAIELRTAQAKDLLDLSPELVIDDALQIPVFPKEIVGARTSPVIPDRAKVKSNSLEDLSQLQTAEKCGPKAKCIAFKVPESTTPRDIPKRPKLRSRSGSSPKSLPESLNKPCPLSKMESILSKKKKKVSSLGKMARDSLLALNVSEEEIADFRRSYKLTSVESLKSLESVSEDANSQSGNSVDSRCRSCLRTSQESLMSLDSINEDCKCVDDNARPSKSLR